MIMTSMAYQLRANFKHFDTNIYKIIYFMSNTTVLLQFIQLQKASETDNCFFFKTDYVVILEIYEGLILKWILKK